MAITPKEAIGAKLELEQKVIDALESRIEDSLRKNYDGRGGVSIDPTGVSDFAIREVVKRFEAAGWIVKFSDNQRDGSNLSFSATEAK